MKKNLFRKVSLDKMASPEQLDEMVRITPVKLWQALVTIGIILMSLLIWGNYGRVSIHTYGRGVLLEGEGVYRIQDEEAGRVLGVYVTTGEEVVKGNRLLQIEQKDTGKKVVLTAPIDGKILEIPLHDKEHVKAYQTLMTIQQKNKVQEGLQVVAYVPIEEGKKIVTGMQANIEPSTFNRVEYGTLKAEVVSVSEYAVTSEAMLAKLGNQSVINELVGQKPHLEVVLALDKGQTPTGYKWTTKKGPEEPLRSGTLCQVAISVEEKKPIQLLFPFIK